MEKDKEIVNESIDKIKYMINYDSTKTFIENHDTINEQTKPGEMLGKTAAATGIATGAGALAGGIAAPLAFKGALATGGAALGATNAATTLGIALGGTVATAGAIGGAAIVGTAALALTPLVLWLIDKDKVRPKVEKLFKYVADNKSKIDQVPRGLDDDAIWNLSDQLYTAMKRLGTREKDVYNAFSSLQTISDLSALITIFNSDNGDLMKWLDKDFDQTREWMKIYRPIRDLVRKFAQEVAEQQGQESQQQSTPGETHSSAIGGYKFVKGTDDDPYIYGTLGSGIAEVQKNLGFTGTEVDGKWGPKTQAKMQELAPEFVKGYSNSNLMDVIKVIRDKARPENVSAPIANIPKISSASVAPSIRKSNVQNPSSVSVAPEMNKSKLSLAPLGQQIQQVQQKPISRREARRADRRAARLSKK